MKDFFKFRFISIRTGQASVLYVLFGLFLILPVLLSNCDLMGKSIDEFIDENTGNVKFKSISVLPEISSTSKIIGKVLMVDPDDNEGILVVNVTIDNPHRYDVDVSPVIYQFIGSDGVPVSNPDEWKGYISCDVKDTATVEVTIGNAIKKVHRGDSFRIRLDIKTVDGIRVLDSMDLPRIIYDSPLLPVFSADVVPDTTPLSNFKWKTIWKMQDVDTHNGINKISVTFTSLNDGIKRIFEFQSELGSDNLTWDKISGDAVYDYKLNATKAGNSIECEIPFPFSNMAYENDDSFAEGYKFLIILWDKNGLSVKTGEGGSPETYLEDLKIRHHLRDKNVWQDSVWVFDNRDKLRYNMTVPYNVDKVEFRATPNTNINGSQEVHWAEGHDNTKVFSLIVGQNADIIMSVVWKNPDGSPEDDDIKLTYAFTITRYQPNKDSQLKELIVEGSATSGGTYTPYPLVNPLDPAQSYYTVYVPPSVNYVKILGTYLNTSTIYTETGLEYDDEGKLAAVTTTSAGPPYPEYGPQILFKDYYPDEDWGSFGDISSLNAVSFCDVKDGWSYPTLKSGNYTFYFYVKSEYDLTAFSSSCYVITVIKTDHTGNPDAQISGLTINAGAVTILERNNETVANQFYPDVLNYTINVPSAAGAVTLNVTPLDSAGKKAEIREITCVRSINGAPYAADTSFSYDLLPITENSTIPIVFNETNLTKKFITLTVYGAGDSIAPRNYTITLVKCISALSSTPQLTSGDKNLTVTWSAGIPGISKYEVWYSTLAANPYLVPEKAWKWKTDFASSGVVISSLENYEKYYVWVRGINSNNIPGDWTPATITGNNGVPGPAELAAINFSCDYTPPAPAPVFSPAFNPKIHDYLLTIPGATTALGLTAAGAWVNNPLPAGTGSVSPLQAEGTSAVRTIIAYPPDGKTPDNYRITVVRKLRTPVLNLGTVQTGSIQLSWDANTAAGSYDIFYRRSVETDAQAKIIPNVSGTSYTIQGLLSDGTAYVVWVRSKNTAGDIFSENSNTVSTVPQNGSSGGISYTWDHIPETADVTINLTTDYSAYLDLLNNTSIQVGIPTTYVNYKWFIDGQPAVNGTYVSGAATRDLTVSARFFTAAFHTISVRVEANGYWYSKNLVFEVRGLP